MERTIGILESLGLVLAGGTLALLVRPDIAATLGVQSLLSATDNGYYLVVGVAAVGLFYGLYIGMSWWIAEDVQQIEPPTVETFAGTAIPGSELDEALVELAGKRGRAARPVEHRELIRDRLRTDAIRTVARVEQLPRDEAVALVDAGDWTQNRYASGFVGGASAPGPRWHQVARDWVLRRDAFSRRVRQTIAALSQLQEPDR